MAYEMFFLVVDRPVTVGEAKAALGEGGGWLASLRHDRRLDPFLAALEQRWPGIRGGTNRDLVLDLVVRPRTIRVSLGWPDVMETVPDLARIAWRSGLAVYDPQREVVGMPQPFADAPLGPDGLEQHVPVADQVVGGAVTGALIGGRVPDEPAQPVVSAQLRAIGASRKSPLGFEITAELEDEVLANPERVPTALQTTAWRDELVAALGSSKTPERHRALVTLGGWDPDDAVAAALRPLVASDDVTETGLAAAALARQGDITDLPALLAATYRLSPADGATTDAMVAPLQASLRLAEAAGPEIVAGVKARARQWRGTPRTRRHDWQAPAEAALDELLAE